MALIFCKECKNQVSTSAKVCPHCGKTLRMGTAAKILLVLIGAGFLLWIKSDLEKYEKERRGSVGGQAAPSLKSEPPTFGMREAFIVDETEYVIEKATWAKEGGNPFAEGGPKNRLVVTFTVKNLKDHTSVIRPMHVIGEDGITTDHDPVAGILSNLASPLQTIPSGTKKKSAFYFDVPKKGHYRLHVDGNQFKDEVTYVELQTASEAKDVMLREFPKVIVRLCRRGVLCGKVVAGTREQDCDRLERAFLEMKPEKLWTAMKETHARGGNFVGFNEASFTRCLAEVDQIPCDGFKEKFETFLNDKSNNCESSVILDSPDL